MAKGIIEEDERPNVRGLEYYLEAFAELGTCRQIGSGIGPIPFTSILEYAAFYNVEDFEEFIYLIRQMDSAYIGAISKSPKQGGDNGSANADKNHKNHK